MITASLPALRLRVPATSANLGPGYDTLGLAWDLCDEVRLAPAEDFSVQVRGYGAGDVPSGPDHLVLRTLIDGLGDLGSPPPPGIALSADNVIPHGSGLGSSAAAVITGLLAAWTWAHPGVEVDQGWILRRARAAEGHLDNVAPALFGGLALVVPGEDRALSLPLDERVVGAAYIPQETLPTPAARGVLPSTVPHADAAATAGSAALLVHALACGRTELFSATRDWLHQPYRAPLMTASAALVERLRKAGYAAVISGAGPTVVVLGTGPELANLPGADGFSTMRLRPGPGASVSPLI